MNMTRLSFSHFQPFYLQTLSWTSALPMWASQGRWCMSRAPSGFTMPQPGSSWTWWLPCPLTCCMPSTSQWWVQLDYNISTWAENVCFRIQQGRVIYLLCHCACTCLSSLDFLGPPPQDCTPVAPPSSASEAGSLLPVQLHGADLTDVCVCPAGTLDGLHLVHDWTQGARDQWELGHWWVWLNPGLGARK